jgi:hypothetical protein
VKSLAHTPFKLLVVAEVCACQEPDVSFSTTPDGPTAHTFALSTPEIADSAGRPSSPLVPHSHRSTS